MKFYHGSKYVIEQPKQYGSNPFNDYGPSFYCTEDIEKAKSWACKNDSVGVVNQYSIRKDSFSALKILDLTDKSEYGLLNWMAILMHFRHLDKLFIEKNQNVLKWLEKYYIDVTQYDLVIGFRADDSYFRFPISFINNDLSIEDLKEVYMLGNLGIQYAFMSNKAIKSLKFELSFECETSFLGKHLATIIEANKEFDKMLSKPRDINKTYIMDLMRADNEN